MGDGDELIKIRVDDHILTDPKITSMEPIVFTRRLNNTAFMKLRVHHDTDVIEMLMKQTTPNYHPRNVSKEKLKSHQDQRSFNKFINKWAKVNKEREMKNLEIKKLLSSVELAFEKIMSQKEVSKGVTYSNIENNDKHTINTEQNANEENEDWSSEDEEKLINIVKKKPKTLPLHNTTGNIDNETVIQSIHETNGTPTKRSGPITVIFANEGVMAVHQGTKQERYDIGSDGSLGRFYIKLPPPPMDAHQSIVKIVCCLYKRVKVINELLEEFFIQPSAVNFMSTIHKCSNGKCVCCCKPTGKDMNYEGRNIQSHWNTSAPPEPGLQTPLVTNVHQDRNLPNTNEINSIKTLDELVNILTTNYSGITLTEAANGKLTAIFSTTPSSWDSIKIRILTEILTKISQKLTASGESLHEFCKQINSMVNKKNLYSSVSAFMGVKQSKSIILFMKTDEIKKQVRTLSNVITKKTVLPMVRSQRDEQTTAHMSSRKRKNDDKDVNYKPENDVSLGCSTKRGTQPSLLYDTSTKWATSNKSTKKSVSVTDLIAKMSVDKESQRRRKKKSNKPTCNLKKTAETTSQNSASKLTTTKRAVRASSIPETTQAPEQEETSFVTFPKKNPILFEILSNDNMASQTSDKFNITKLPLQYLVSKPERKKSVSNNTMATLTPNESIVLSSDEEVIDLD